jgi:TolA-binding protein
MFTAITRFSIVALAVVAVVVGVSWANAGESDDQFAVAAGHYDRQQWKLAVEEFQLFLQKYPNDPRTAQGIFFQGEALLQLGQLGQALDCFHQYVRREPDGKYARAALFRAGEAAFLTGNHASAKTDLEKFLAKYSDDRLNAFVLPYLGDIALTAGDTAAAAGYFRDGLKKYPEGLRQEDCRLGLARALEKQNQTAEAERLYRELIAAPKGQLKADAQLACGSLLLAQKKYAEAIVLLEAFLQSKPSGDTAVKAAGELAVCYARSKQIDKAKKVYTDLLEKNPKHPLIAPLTELLAEAAYDANDTAWSAELSARLAKAGNSAEYETKGSLGLGWSLFKAGKLEEAATAFDDVLKKNPPQPIAVEALLVRGRILEQLGRSEPALAMYERVIEKYPADKRHAEALFSAARLHDQRKQYQKAADLYRRLSDAQPQFTELDAVLYRWAWAMQELKQPEETNRLLDRLRKEFPKSRFAADASYRLAERAVEAKNYDLAAKLLDEVLNEKAEARDPADPDVLQIREYAMFLRGRMAEDRADWPSVRKTYEQFLQTFPNSARRLLAEFWIAESFYRQGDYAAAAPRFDRLAEQIKQNHKPWMAMIPLRRAQILAQQNRWKDAHAIASKINGDFPDFPQQYEVDYLLGRCLADQADFDGARQAYQRVIHSTTGAKTETAAMAQWMIGETYFHQKNYEAAYREYLKVEILYDYPACQAGGLLQAGKCREHLGDEKEAANLYQRILKNYPNTPYAPEATQRLKILDRAKS